MSPAIYTITNTATGEQYVGSARYAPARWSLHTHYLEHGRHHSKRLQESWDKYPDARFEFRVILFCESADLLMYEQRTLDVLKPAYNVSPTAGSTRGVKYDVEYKQRCSTQMIQRIRDNPEAHKLTTAKANAATREMWADPARRAERVERIKAAAHENLAKRITYNGETKTRQEWAELLNIAPSTLDHRIKHWGVAKALTTQSLGSDSASAAKLRSARQGKLYEFRGEMHTLTHIARALGTSRQAIRWHMNRGKALGDVIAYYEQKNCG